MIVVINDDRVTDVEGDFAKEAVEKDPGCISMEVLTDPVTPGRVVYLSHFESEEAFRSHASGPTFQKHVEKLGKYFISAEDTILEVR